MARETQASKTSSRASRAHDTACSLTLGIVLAATAFASLMTVGMRTFEFLAKSSYGPLIAIGASLAIGALVALASYFALRNMKRIVSWADAKRTGIANLSFGRREVIAASALIFICWIPWIIVQYPCAMNEDTYNQLYQFQTGSPTYYTTLGIMVDESFIDHHPIFDTLLFGSFLALGDAIGSQNAGLFAYSLFQSALTALGLGITCCYLERLEVPWLFRVVSLAFCALFPPLPLWTASMVKDSFNACLFIFFCLITTEIVRTRGAALASKRLLAAYAFVAILCMATKKSGVITVVATSVMLVVLFRGQWRALLLGTAVPLVVCFALAPALIYPAIGGVAPGGKQEAVGFALQQMITAIEEDDDLSAWERERLDAVLDVDRALEKHQPELVDPVKNSVHADAATRDYLSLIPAYLSVGARHPGAYAASAFNIAGTLISPGRTLTFFHAIELREKWLASIERADVNGELHLTFDKPEPFASAADAVDNWWRTFIPKLGPLQVFFDSGFYGGWIPLTCLVLCLFHNRRWSAALAPAFSVVLVLFIGPASSIRYILPLLFTTPLMLGIACASLREDEHLPEQGNPRHERKSEASITI